MLTRIICHTIRASVRHSWLVIGIFVLLVAASTAYVAGHFAINTDVSTLIDPNAGWAKRDAAIAKAFPQRADTTLVVVRAPAAAYASAAARELAQRLRAQPALFRSVSLGADSDFFVRNGLLFLPPDQVAALDKQLTDARPLLNALAHDPSLRGLANLLSVSLLTPLQSGQLHLADMAPLLAPRRCHGAAWRASPDRARTPTAWSRSCPCCGSASCSLARPRPMQSAPPPPTCACRNATAPPSA
jgi:hypothetical protein